MTTPRSHYDVLEVPSHATQDEIRNAFRRMKENVLNKIEMDLAPGEKDLEQKREIEAAFETLSDPDQRARYDEEMGISRRDAGDGESAAAAERIVEVVRQEEALGEGIGAQVIAGREDGVTTTARAATEEIPDDIEIDGPFLKKLREGRGIDLKAVAKVTRIGASHLEDIEEERFSSLPAVVYVRGFLTSYARYLKIDPSRACRHYLKRFQQFLASGGRAAPR